MDEHEKKRIAKLSSDLDAGRVPEELKFLTRTLRELSEKFQKPFPPGTTDAVLARAAYFTKGPKKVLSLIEDLYDDRQRAYQKQTTGQG